MAKKSHLYSYHSEHGKITEFGGFDMPLWYTSIVEEHNAVRYFAGLFDVSHMGRFKIQGRDSTLFLNKVLPSDVSKIRSGRAFYSVLCNSSGGIIDDTVTNKFSDIDYTMVVNAANREKDIRWLKELSGSYSVEIKDESDDSALIAFQGPLAISLLQKITDADLNSIRRFGVFECRLSDIECVVSRSGYTGEDGFEITVLDSPIDAPYKAQTIWNSLLNIGKEKGVIPCGLGARDSLRLEAGMCLYGNDIDETTTPIEAALANIVSLEKPESYVGGEVIRDQLRNGTKRRRVCFSMVSGGVPRHGYEIKLAGSSVGIVTSGSFSPTIKNGIGMGYVPTEISSLGQSIWIKIREQEQTATIVVSPFYDTSRFGFKRTA
jgi:aminomethyltransferase